MITIESLRKKKKKPLLSNSNFSCFFCSTAFHPYTAYVFQSSTKWTVLTDTYPMTSSFATIDADIRFAGSTEYSARAFRMDLV